MKRSWPNKRKKWLPKVKHICAACSSPDAATCYRICIYIPGNDWSAYLCKICHEEIVLRNKAAGSLFKRQLSDPERLKVWNKYLDDKFCGLVTPLLAHPVAHIQRIWEHCKPADKFPPTHVLGARSAPQYEGRRYIRCYARPELSHWEDVCQ